MHHLKIGPQIGQKDDLQIVYEQLVEHFESRARAYPADAQTLAKIAKALSVSIEDSIK
jgi:hypothetical protein